MGNRISRRQRRSGESSSSARGSSFDYTDGTASNHSTPKFPDLLNRNEEEEAARQRSEHFLLKHIFQKSYFAPVESLLQDPTAVVVEYGQGTCGTWAVEMANDFPKPMFYCLDLREEPNLQDILHIPLNTHFEMSNILQGLNLQDNSVDFLHQRMMQTAYHGDDIAYVIREMRRVLRPGGWLELIEYDIVPRRAGPLFTTLVDKFIMYLKKKHRYLINGPRLRRFIAEGGFEDVQADYASIPICWGGYMGKYMYENCLSLMRFVGPHIYKELLNTEEEFNEAEYDAYVDKAFDECVQYQTFVNVHWAYGRKPSTV